MYRERIIDLGEKRNLFDEFWKMIGGEPPAYRRFIRQREPEKFTSIPNEVMENMKYLPATVFKVYMYLIRHDWADATNYQGCFLKMKTLAAETGYSKATVSKAVAELRTFGWLETQPAGQKKMPNGRTADLDCFEYTFFYPVDGDGVAIVSPTKEQAAAYKKFKNEGDVRIKDDNYFATVRKLKMKEQTIEDYQERVGGFRPPESYDEPGADVVLDAEVIESIPVESVEPELPWEWLKEYCRKANLSDEEKPQQIAAANKLIYEVENRVITEDYCRNIARELEARSIYPLPKVILANVRIEGVSFGV